MEYCDIQLTDIQLHILEPRKPQSLLRKVLKSVRNGKPGRAYMHTSNANIDKDGTFSIPLPSETEAKITQGLRDGKKIRFFVPKDGLPILAGKDLVNFIEARNSKQLNN